MKFGALAPFPQKLGSSKTNASQYYNEIQNMIGDAFTIDLKTIVGAENIADARLFGSIQDASDRCVNNSIPSTSSSDAINDWVYRYGVSKEENDDETRKSLAAKYSSIIGPTYSNISNSLYNLIGDKLLSIDYNYGVQLSDPPTVTYWAANPGAESINMGGMGDAWMSGRQHICVNVNCKYIEFLSVKRKVQECLDNLLPAFATYSINFGPSGRFKLGLSKLGYNVL